MKRCPFCAEEIQDAAIVCRFCNRELKLAPIPAPTTSERPRGHFLFVGGLVAVGLLVIMTTFPISKEEKRASDQPSLDVSAGRGYGGFSFTNQGSETLSKCDVSVRAGENGQWVATIQGAVQPSATQSTEWADFKRDGRSMPPYLGLAQQTFTISCWLDSIQKRRSADLGVK